MLAQLIYNPPRDTGLDVVRLDDSFLVVNKPAGLLSVPGRGADKTESMITRVQAEFPDALVVHRLDMATSGLMLLARGSGMQKRFFSMFREREVTKCYEAIVGGVLTSEAGEVDLPLSADWPNRPRQKVDVVYGKKSITRFRLLGNINQLPGRKTDANRQASRMELELVTGRTHQLRLHMAAIGHPILGDALYGQRDSGERLMLHASRLAFTHPFSGDRIEVVSTAPF